MTLKYIDICSGIGGLSLPFYQALNECVMISEIDKFAIKTYEKNFTHKNSYNCGDITIVDPESVPDHDVMMAGFPCPSFSVAGKRLGFKDIRGTVIFSLANILIAKQPKAFLFENVKGLVNHDEGKTLQTILDALDDAGYNVVWKVLKADEFGSPQTRHRIYIVGFRKDIKSDHFKFPESFGEGASLGRILEFQPDEKYTLSLKMWNYLLARKDEQMKKGNGFGYRMYQPSDQYVGTLSARYGKDGSEILIRDMHCPTNPPRRLTPSECSRLMGFPVDFDLTACSDTQLYKQFGNSVYVPIIKCIYDEMRKII